MRDFRRYLIQEKVDIALKDARLRRRTNHTSNNHSISWIDSLLETPIEDYRKFAMWRILAPYLINIKNVSYNVAFDKIKNWLNDCNKMRPLDFNVDHRIKDNLRAATQVGYFPISLNDLKEQNRGLNEKITRKTMGDIIL